LSDITVIALGLGYISSVCDN